MIHSWLEKGPSAYHELQKTILDAAVHMLRPGGMLLYSTCTFSPKEDEETIAYVLEQYPTLSLAALPKQAGFCDGLPPYEGCIRLYPHRIEGEGHFLALLQKRSDASEAEGQQAGAAPRGQKQKSKVPSEVLRAFDEFLQHVHSKALTDMLEKQTLLYVESNLYLLPEALPYHDHLRYLRTGLLLGTMERNGRWEPSQALAMYLKKADYAFCMELSSDDINVTKYLKGETLLLPREPHIDAGKVPVLVCADGFPLGWGKVNQHMLKNKYPVGWRMQS